MSTETPIESNRDTSGTYFLIGITVLGAAVLALALSPSTRPFAIALGGGVPAGLGVIALLVGALDAFMKRDKSTGDQNFSSFPDAEERSFIVQEKTMRANGHAANVIGWGIAAGGLLLGALIVAALYSPCYQYCQRPAGSCDTEDKASAFKRTCENACASLEKQSGLQVLQPTGNKVKNSEGKEETEMAMRPVTGTEYLQTLAGCSFAGGAGRVCEKVVENATSLGLWCPEKK